MRRLSTKVVAVLFLAIILGGSAFAAEIQPTGRWVPGEALVKIQAGASNQDIADIEQEGDVDSDDQLSDTGSGTIWRVHSRSKSTDALISSLRRHPKVIYAEPNYIVHAILTPNDPSFSQLYGMTKISAPAAWNVTTGSANVVVGVVDTGVDYNHQDLAANMWSNPGGIGGCAAGTRGFNAITNTCTPLDDNDHGSHVSGTIGGVGNNGIGVAGVNWTVRIMGLKFLDATGSGSTADAIQAIDFAVIAKIAGINVRVLANSWGGGGFSQALLDEINKANTNGILFVAAAGNSGANNDSTPHYPSSYNAPNVISVAATDSADALASFSNYGATSVHLGAPGVSILSTTTNNTYSSFSGTSMACPHVAGVAALVLSVPVNASMTVAQLKSAILNNVDPIPSLTGMTTTGGRLNASKAVGPGTPCTPPAAPAGLIATGGEGRADLTWGTVSGATEYHVLRSNTTGGPYAQVGVSTTTSFANTGLAAGTYFYVVRAFATCESGNSNEASAVVTAPPVPPDFSLSVSPSSLSVRRTGGTAAYTMTITRTGGFTGNVSLSVTGQPAGATTSFSPNPAGGTSSTLSVTVAPGTTRRTYTLTVTGTSGSLSRTASASLVVTK